ncbi:conserved Plasmodium protein, unknown function [Plasmodium chabaudi adami]|uniref:Uncharacterized protein n=1 Tax=Plasmodium chabaudi adami TaxID=5826 RepID=A0A1C6XCF0_PLACE|nr:conserved Plasmodium protein, unknown function [Plasmodium chabaudi adami]
MDKPDIEYLNIPQKIKKKLYENSLNTVEKINTYYLENLEFEEIELVQDEIFKYHINDLGINNTEENERTKSLTKDNLITNDFYSYSDVENYCNNNDILGSSENNYSDSSEMSISSYSSSNSYHYKNSEKNSKDNLKKFNDPILKGCTQNWVSKIEDIENEKKKYYCVQNELEKYFLIYSNFMKNQLKINRTINTNCISLNRLLNNGIENSQIYFFYGNNAKINKIILINLLYNFIYPPGNNNMSTHSVVYIYFSHTFDITVIKNILSEKINYEKKTQEQKSDFFNNFYILRIQSFNEIISFLLQLKKNYFTKNKSETDNSLNNGLNNIRCIGIYNFTNIIKNFNISNQNYYFYLIHELKLISKLLGISILIFDYAPNEISDTTSSTNIGDTKKESIQEMNNTSTYDDENVDSEMYNKSSGHMSGKAKHHGVATRKYINNNLDCYSDQSSSFYSDNYSDNDEQTYSEYESGNNFNIDPKIKDIEKGGIIKIPFSCSKHNKFDFIIEIKMVNKIRDKYIIRFTLVKSRTNIKHSYSYCSIQKCVLTDLG